MKLLLNLIIAKLNSEVLVHDVVKEELKNSAVESIDFVVHFATDNKSDGKNAEEHIKNFKKELKENMDKLKADVLDQHKDSISLINPLFVCNCSPTDSKFRD